MRNLPWKKIAIGAIGVVIFVSAIFYFTTGKGDKMPGYINPAFGEYISTYTAGVIPSASTVRIVLVSNVADSASIGQEISAKVFDFNPSIKGKAFWLDARTIEFRPQGRLKSGQIYEANFLLSKLMTVPEDLNTFHYSFQIIPQNFELTVDNVKPYVKTELTRQKIEGTVLTADFAENDAIEKILTAQQDGKSLKIAWTHAGEGKQHMFIVEDVARKEEASKVKLVATGKPLDVINSYAQEVEIPALGDFKVMNSKIVQNPSQYVVLQFSDPLKETQDLGGLISIGDNGSLTLDFEIHDNEIWVYPPVRQSGTKTVYIEAGVRNINDYPMKKPSTVEVVFEQLKPEVRFLGKGSILPSTDGLILPFEAVNLRAVNVSITKVFENNITQFLQVNNLDGSYQMHRVGRNILRKTIRLDNAGTTDFGKWNRYTLDLAKLINTEPGAIYQVSLDFKKAFAAYVCEGDDDENMEEIEEGDLDLDDNGYQGDGGDYYDGYEDEYYYEDYDWEQRENPCHSSYYSRNRKVTRNVLASDLGIIAKRGSDGNTVMIVTDLRTTQPIQGVELEFLDFQQQSLGIVTTDATGKAVFSGKGSPFVVVAKNGSQRGYLRLIDGEALSVSNFDVSGEFINRGLKGFLYGDRGVWRPGDSLYLSFMLEDKNKVLPAAHPVVFELENPQGVVAIRLVKSVSENGFYKFATATSADAPTGNWTAHVKVGGTQFTQNVKIETVKPNRLKINLSFGGERITSPSVTGNLEVKWLHGAPGRNLKAQFDVTLFPSYTTFPKFTDYNFEDNSRRFTSEKQTVWEGSTDAEGKATFNTELSSSEYLPGFMTAVFNGKVFEESGNFSIDRFAMPFYPYKSYVGMKTASGERYSGMLYTDTTQRIDVVFVDIDGKPVARENAEIGLYRLERYWWWDNGYSSIANYIEQQSSALVSKGKINAPNGKGSWSFKIHPADWGTYYIKVTDPVSGHSSGKTVYIDQRGYFGRYSREQKGGATTLSFTSNKQAYNVGEKITLSIPGSGQGRALVSVENGSKTISTFWVETQKGDNKFTIDATPEMAPNIFVNVSLLQPHSQTVNDLPIRLYGIIPIGIEDPKTHLEPVITMPEELEPGKEVVIKVSEKSNRKMTFTLAMVDEGLLDITKFKTPEPWKRFYAREALGVKTWDLYDAVMGAFGSRVERLLSIGGDMEGEAKDEDPRANRFKPVVKFFGPITIDAGDDKEIKFIMPQYIGSVRTMVVAGYEGAYGNTEKATPVRKPLMVLATLPRVLGPEEKLRLPVTLFTQNKKIKNVKIDVKVTGPISLPNGGSQTVEMSPSGDMTVDFDLAVKSEMGIAKVVVTASSGSFESSDEIEIEVRNPNPPASQAVDMILEAGKTWNGAVTPIGIAGTNSAVVEVSSIPPINLGYRLYHLMQYPHGCVEQTTSAAFPQLYLDVIKELDEPEKNRIKYNITTAIERLRMFVTRDGGFGYWPGYHDSDGWGTTYAGHFLLEAESKGYYVPADMLKRWKKHQKNKALEWRKSEYPYYYNPEIIQAYRLYTLALAGSPELSAMNRLRETPNISLQAKWLLAAAYAKAGQPEAGKKIVQNLTMQIKDYQELGYSYGSSLRDKAIILETLVLLNDRVKGIELVKEISNSLSNQGYWMSTQTTAFCLKAIGVFIGNEKRGDLKFSYTYAGKSVNATTELPIAQVPLGINGLQKNPIKVTNESKGTLFVRLITTGTPARGQEEAAENNLSVSVRYTDKSGRTIDPAKLEQGTQFFASVTVKNPGIRGHYQNMALAQIFPSGWEINNLRLTDDENTAPTDRGDYQDIRDDRVYTYFNLNEGNVRTFQISLTATYAGTYYLPAVGCEAMYDHSIYGRTKGQVVEVVKPAGVE